VEREQAGSGLSKHGGSGWDNATPLLPCMTVAACLGFRDPPLTHVLEWLTVHRRVGIAHFFLHEDGGSTNLTQNLTSAPYVTFLATSRFEWREEIEVAFGLRSRFVGQTDFLMRCVDAASTRSTERWLANLDVDEYLLPELPHSKLATAIDAAAHGATCVSLRRHNFYMPEHHSSGGQELPPLRTRLRRAPFPPDGRSSSSQPFLPKWIVRVPASPSLVVNMHDTWLGEGCRTRCSDQRGVARPSSTPELRADPAGLGAIRRLAEGPAGLPLLAALLSPLSARCLAPSTADASRCLLSPRSLNVTEETMRQPLLRCLSAPPGQAGPAGSGAPWCWRPACHVRGDAAERHARINHYGHPALPGQRHGYDLAVAGPAVADESALRFLPQ